MTSSPISGRHLLRPILADWSFNRRRFTINVVKSTGWDPRRLAIDHRHRRRCSSALGLNLGWSPPPLPSPTCSPLLWLSFPTTGQPWGATDRWDLLDVATITSEPLLGPIPATSDGRLAHRQCRQFAPFGFLTLAAVRHAAVQEVHSGAPPALGLDRVGGLDMVMDYPTRLEPFIRPTWTEMGRLGFDRFDSVFSYF